MSLPNAPNESSTTRFARWLGAVWRAWRGRAAFTLIDHAVFSGATFAANVLLARWLSPTEYGTFSVGFSLAFFLYGPYAAILIEPVALLRPTRYRNVGSSYERSLVRSHWLPALVLSVLSPATSFFTGSHALSLVLPLVLPFFLLTQLLRAVCYADGRPDRALRGSACYAVVLTALVAALQKVHSLTAASALSAVGVANVIASLAMLIARPVTSRDEDGEAPVTSSSEVLREHWSLGKSLLVPSFAANIVATLFLPAIAVALGAAHAAVLRSLQLLINPCQQALTALSTLALPRLAQQTDARGSSYLLRAGAGFMGAIASVASAYAVILMLVHEELVLHLFGPYYARFAWGCWAVAALLVAQSIGNGLGIILRAQQNLRRFVHAKLASLAVLVAAGAPLVAAYGLAGALWTLPLVAAVEAIMSGIATTSPGRRK